MATKSELAEVRQKLLLYAMQEMQRDIELIQRTQASLDLRDKDTQDTLKGMHAHLEGIRVQLTGIREHQARPVTLRLWSSFDKADWRGKGLMLAFLSFVLFVAYVTWTGQPIGVELLQTIQSLLYALKGTSPPATEG